VEVELMLELTVDSVAREKREKGSPERTTWTALSGSRSRDGSMTIPARSTLPGRTPHCPEDEPNGRRTTPHPSEVRAAHALRLIPGHEELVKIARQRNPHKRLTVPEDVARCITALCHPATYWMTGNTLHVDGGENVIG
jgi:hypothetical protein